jgi:hypothetical protein
LRESARRLPHADQRKDAPAIGPTLRKEVAQGDPVWRRVVVEELSYRVMVMLDGLLAIGGDQGKAAPRGFRQLLEQLVGPHIADVASPSESNLVLVRHQPKLYLHGAALDVRETGRIAPDHSSPLAATNLTRESW